MVSITSSSARTHEIWGVKGGEGGSNNEQGERKKNEKDLLEGVLQIKIFPEPLHQASLLRGPPPAFFAIKDYISWDIIQTGLTFQSYLDHSEPHLLQREPNRMKHQVALVFNLSQLT